MSHVEVAGIVGIALRSSVQVSLLRMDSQFTRVDDVVHASYVALESILLLQTYCSMLLGASKTKLALVMLRFDQ